MKTELSGSNALITGAAKRIGREIAISLAEKGVNILIHYRSSNEEAEELKGKLRGLGVKAISLQADLKKNSDLEGLISRAKSKVDRLDYLVNNAAVFPPGSLNELEFEELVDNVRINAWAPFYLARSFVELSECGKVVNLLDTRVAGYDWDHAGYYFSKILLARMTKMMAIKFAPEFTVNGVAPGLVIPPEGLGENYLKERTDRVPLKKHGEEEDVSRAIIYLLESNFVTGQIIYVDGGRNLLHELEG